MTSSEGVTMIVKPRMLSFREDSPDLSERHVEKCRVLVKDRYPEARWICGAEFGRIVAGTLLLSLRFRLIDPQAEDMAWRDASQRLGEKLAKSPLRPPWRDRRETPASFMD